MTIMWINPSYVKKYATVMDNVDPKFIKSHILEAQNIEMHRILGGWMYDDMITEYINNNTTGATISTAYSTLVDEYIKPILLYYTVYYCMYDLYCKITNKGIEVQSSDNSEPISESILEKKKSSFKNLAENYAENLTNYLRQNQDDYPKWKSNDPDNPYRILPEKDTNYRTGMHFINSRSKSNRNRCINFKNLRNI